MLNRRNIRETAIQFLYFKDLQGNPDTSEVEEAFWDISQESSISKLNYARAKALLHVAQGRDSKFAKLTKQAPTVLAQLKATPDTETLTNALKKITLQQNKLHQAISELKTAVKSKESKDLPANLIDAVTRANQDIAASHQSWHDSTLGFPTLKNRLEEISATIKQLSESSQRFVAVEDPDSPLTDFAHLRASHSEIQIARQQIKDLVDQVTAHQGSIDTAMEETIENFKPERVDLVDKAIMRLAIYEMKHCDDIPRSVSIDEAIEIAKRFGTTASSRFINGVLDSIK